MTERRRGPTVIVDASVVASRVLPDPLSDRVASLWADWTRVDADLAAPALMLAEVTNAIYRRVRRGAMPADLGRRALDVVVGHGVRLVVSESISLRAWDLASSLGQGSAYDAHYLALAQIAGGMLWTVDERLWNAARASGFAEVRWVGEPAGV